MALELRKRVVEMLSSRPEERFKARDIARWICDNYPEEAAEKLQASASLKSRTKLLKQLVAGLGAIRSAWQRMHPHLRRTALVGRIVVRGSLICAILGGAMAVAAASSWEQSMERVAELRDELNRKADALGYGYLGSALNEVDVKEHSCAILGRMLGKAEVISHLEMELPTDSADGYEFRVAAQSLDNWLVNARRLLDLDRSRRVRLWNLNCVGMLGIPLQEQIAEEGEKRDAFYDIDSDRRILRILGDVTVGFAARLKETLDAHPEVKVVALGSHGGVVVEAIQAGVEIRRRGLETTLWDNCYSACPLVFAGGVYRTIWSPYPELGFHRIHTDGIAVPADAPIYSLVENYLRAMGIQPYEAISLMMAAQPDDIHVADLQRLCDMAFATWVQRACSH